MNTENPVLRPYPSPLSCMMQVAVALAKGIDVPHGSDAGEAAEGFAAALMQAWGVGEAGCNDGAVLLLSLQPRQVCSYIFSSPLQTGDAETMCRVGTRPSMFCIAHALHTCAL